MKSGLPIVILFVYVASTAAMIFPFLPGNYDPLAIPLAMTVQLYSGLGLITLLPAAFWLYNSMNSVVGDTPHNKNRHGRIFFWTNLGVGSLIAFFIARTTSLAVGLAVFTCLVIATVLAFRRLVGNHSGKFPSARLVLAITFLPVWLFCFHMLLADPLTSWSRLRSIAASEQIIREIEQHKARYGSYPLSLNGLWKDYPTVIVGVEKYEYTYDESTYNLSFRQPRFAFDRLGTDEIVVYNPNDDHIVLSHASWHVSRAPGEVYQGQGWYESKDVGVPHWKIFWFD